MTTTPNHRQLADDCRLLSRIYRMQGRIELADDARRRMNWHRRHAREVK